MYFWAGVSAIAGALRRKVWLDQANFKWYSNMYIVLVAPPGIVSKTTTASLAMNLLRKVPGIHFGPDVVTWPALVTAFASSTEGFEVDGLIHPMSAITLESGEFGNLVNPRDEDMVNLLISLWDCKEGVFDKRTKNCGEDKVENPWINMIACTTPAWIAGNFPEYMIGGGFTSRCLFVYAAKKAKLVAYPGRTAPADHEEKKQRLIEDLTAIAGLKGEYRLTPEAEAWGEAWYERHHTVRSANLQDDRFGGYLARKQTHIHKLGMILAAAQGDTPVVTADHLMIADQMVTDLEPDMSFVFERIGKSDAAVYAERLVSFVHSKGSVPYHEAYRHVHAYFPSMRDFEDVLAGCLRAGYVKLQQTNGGMPNLVAGAELPTAAGVTGDRFTGAISSL